MMVRILQRGIRRLIPCFFDEVDYSANKRLGDHRKPTPERRGRRCDGVVLHHGLYRFVLAMAVVSSLSVAGCTPGITEKERDAEAPPAVEQGGYKIGVDDRVQVSVWRNPDLSVIVPVRPDGMISVPLIGDVQAGGKSATDLAADVKQKLALYIRDPNVTIIITELRSHEFLSRVRVTGAVRTPRSTQYRQGMTVVDAVLEAGGLNDFASPNSTKLYRTVDGKTKVYAIELGGILNSGKLETNMKLFPGDVIAVPERLF
jgi:polysaccharide biosynthesis/export protein